MFTAAERNALILTVTFLLLGAGIKALIRSGVELGPFPAAGPPGPGNPGDGLEPASHGGPGAGPAEDPAMGPEAAGRDPGAADGDPGAAAMGQEASSGNPGAAGGEDIADGAAGIPLADARGSGEWAGPQASTPERMSAEQPSAGPPRPAPGNKREARSARKGPPAGKVDLDRASAEQLAEVPGIGPRTAEAIVEYRRAKGGIRNLRELLEVKGIGERKLERIAPWLGTSADGKPSLPGTDPSLPETNPSQEGTADGKAQGTPTGESKRVGSMAVETVEGTGGTLDVTP